MAADRPPLALVETSLRDPRFRVLPPLTLYVHLPWCVKKCPYCDFNSHEKRGEVPEARYVQALVADLERAL
ncbi:MAG TPA: oxygen-independent coproporphyrinogen III oxidase-like protein, partial [Casimicrobiaceae bacterium]